MIDLMSTQSEFGSTDPQEACDDPEIVKLMVEYFYHFDYRRKSQKPKPPVDSQSALDVTTSPLPTQPIVHLVDDAKVFAMAVKYKVRALQDLAIKKFRASVHSHWKHEEFARVVVVVNTSTPSDVVQLRELVVDVMDLYLEAGILTPEIESELSTIPSFAYDLLKRRIPPKPCDCGHPTYEHESRSCLDCGDAFTGCEKCDLEPGWAFCPRCTTSPFHG